MDNEDNKLIAERRAKLARLREAGVAYPNDFRRDALAGQLHTGFGERGATWFDENPQSVRVGGRLMLKRVMGKASFATLQDRLRIADLDPRAQILDARLVEHVGTDLVAPAHVRLGIL